MACHFHFEVLAPHGLTGIEQALADSQLGLSLYHSHFNHKNILRSSGDLIELDMQTSTTDVMVGSGTLFADFEAAIAIMRKLSAVLASADYSHRIGVDNESGTESVWITHGDGRV